MERKEIEEIYNRPLLTLISDAHEIHKKHHVIGEIQACALISFKTGGCQENCKYCSQSAHYQTEVSPLPLMQKEELLKAAKKAIRSGASRICIGAAWREVRDGKAFDAILTSVSAVADLGVEVCCTLGMLTEEQAQKLKNAGLYAYNHNLDTSREFYPQIVTTRTYDDRLRTLDCVENVGLSLCSGGILGMGECPEDRISLLHTLVSRGKTPDSITINLLSHVPGTPLANQVPLPIWDVLRTLATARISAPKSKVRLSAGRSRMSLYEQALSFFAGVNSIFIGEKMLTTAVPNPSYAEDEEMFSLLGLKKC